jgi:hypothetical protein
MLDVTQAVETKADEVTSAAQPAKQAELPNWETPKLEDVSEQVMAQPYIRFT